MSNLSDQVVDLSEDEARAVARELRRYRDMRSDPAVVDVAMVEARAELSVDPAYAYSQTATEQKLAEVERLTQRLTGQAVDAATPFYQLADRVERDRRIDLGDATVRGPLVEVVDHTGWSLDDQYAQPPADLRRVVEATRAADRAAERPRPNTRDATRRALAERIDKGVRDKHAHDHVVPDHIRRPNAGDDLGGRIR
ncbi:MAG: hypothetical protein ACFN4K_06035 [Pauljensenia sp.]